MAKFGNFRNGFGRRLTLSWDWFMKFSLTSKESGLWVDKWASPMHQAAKRTRKMTDLFKKANTESEGVISEINLHRERLFASSLEVTVFLRKILAITVYV